MPHWESGNPRCLGYVFAGRAKCISKRARAVMLQLMNKTPNFKQQKKRREEQQKKRNEEKQRQQAERKAIALQAPKP